MKPTSRLRTEEQLTRSAAELCSLRTVLTFAHDALSEKRGLGSPPTYLLPFRRAETSALVEALTDAVALLEHVIDRKREQVRARKQSVALPKQM